MRKFVWMALAILVSSVSAWPQGTRYNGTVIRSSATIAGASIRVCSDTATGTPCSPLATIYNDKALSSPIAGSTVTADAHGNYGYWVASGCYVEQISAAGSATYQQTICPGLPGTMDNIPDGIHFTKLPWGEGPYPIISNGNFETEGAYGGSILPPPGWFPDAGITASYETATPCEGAQSLKAVFPPDPTGFEITENFFHTATPGDIFYLSAIAKSDGVVTAQVRMTFLDKTNAAIGVDPAATTASASCTPISVTGTAPAGTEYVIVHLSITPTAGGGTAWYDAINLYRASFPGPTTLTGSSTLSNPCRIGQMIYVSGAGCYTTIQAAVTAAGAGDVYIPAGTHFLFSGVTFASSVKLHGAGKDRTIVQVPAGITGFANANQASPLSFGEISDLTIQLQGDNSIGIDQKALTRWDFNRIRFNHTVGKTGQIGIKFHGGNTVSSFSTNVFECEFNVVAGIGALIVDAANDQRIGPGNTFIINNTSTGIKIDGTIDSSGASVPNTTRIIGNRFDTTVAGDVAISLSPTLATNDTWIAYNRFESASTSTHIIIGALADSTRLGPNWYTGGTFWTDAGIRTYIMEPRPFGLPINSTFDFKWRQNFLIDPADDADTYMRVASGATAAQHARVYFKDNIAAADVWALDKDASNNWLLFDPVNSHTHVIAIPNGATKFNSFGATKIVFNGNANSSTAGVDFQSGGAVPASVATIDGTGKFTSLLPTGTAPFVIASTTPVANLGIQNCSNCVVQHRRVAGCATAASLNATCDTTVTWLNSFADANYTATCSGDVVTSGVPIVEGIDISAAKTGAAITVRTLAITAAAAQFTTLDCVSWHD